MPTLGEIVKIATGLLDQLGPAAPEIIALRVDAHRKEGDEETARFWERVVRAMRAINESMKPANLEHLQSPQVLPVLDFMKQPSLVMRPDLKIVTANAAYLEITGLRKKDIVGCPLFDVFPDNPGAGKTDEDGRAGAAASLARVIDRQVVDRRPSHRYDLCGRDGRFIERWWRSVNTPVFDDRGRLTHILNQARDVTAQSVAQRTAPSAPN